MSLFSETFRNHPRPSGRQISTELETRLPSYIETANDTFVDITASSSVTAPTVSTDIISEKTSATGVTIDSVLNKDGSVTVGTGGAIITDTVSEKTSTAGVTVDGTLIKDGGVTTADAGAITTNTISEKTATSGVTIDSTLLKDGGVTATGAITSTIAKSDYEKFISFKHALGPSTGTWTVTRVAQADYVLRKTANAETAIIGVDITEALRITASKGFSLASFNVVFRNITEALAAHTVTLDKVDYADSTAPAVTSVPVTGALATGVDADPQVSAVTVTTPAFNITNNSKYVVEVTVNAAATSVYDFIGIVLRFSRNDM